MKSYSPGGIDNNKQMKLYSHARNCIDINRQMKLYFPGYMEITNKLSSIPLGVWKITDK
jgi:hypothetical protein